MALGPWYMSKFFVAGPIFWLKIILSYQVILSYHIICTNPGEQKKPCHWVLQEKDPTFLHQSEPNNTNRVMKPYNIGTTNLVTYMMSDRSTLPVNERSSWHRAKSQTLTVVSSEQEQNFKSVLQKLFKRFITKHFTDTSFHGGKNNYQAEISTLSHGRILYEQIYWP